MKKGKKILALILAVTLALSVGITVYARTWPDNIDDWSQDDWNEWWRMQNEAANRAGYYYYDPYTGYYWDGNGYCYGNPSYYNNNGYYYNYPINNSNNSYNGYNYYNGILDIYDGNTEGQAQILAKIIYLYGHGVASQTAQACIGWSVMNSVDASGSGVDIGAIAPNFHYDANSPTRDDFGRDLMPLARDIIFRWKAGRAGIGNNGRVLPGGYCWVWSTGNAVTFRNTPNESGGIWNYSYSSPYGS